MAVKTIEVHVVSAEEEIFSGLALMVTASGSEGDLGIEPEHAPLLTLLKPGEVRIRKLDKSEESIYVQGGFLEVQPNVVTVLSDTAIRAVDLDEARVLEAKERAERLLKDRDAQLEYAKVLEDLTRALAQLRILERLKHSNFK
jgi:F-type H+-transporting ATPase subunit epsilon